MKAIILMFDSLNRHLLSPYGDTFVDAPNFARLAAKAVTFENFYAGSMPCMPARREMHTGRHNFLHRSWGPLEPFDDSMPQLLGEAGVHTHLISDHPHYWEDGGGTYHTRYTTWEFFRGQEGDPWKARGRQVGSRSRSPRPDAAAGPINRSYMPTEAEHSQTRCVDAGIHFLETNVDADQWLLQLELFDPHEPFFTHQNYKDKYPHDYSGPEFDWPGYAKVTEPADQVEHARLRVRRPGVDVRPIAGPGARLHGRERHVVRHHAAGQHRPRLPARRARLVGQVGAALVQRTGAPADVPVGPAHRRSGHPARRRLPRRSTSRPPCCGSSARNRPPTCRAPIWPAVLTDDRQVREGALFGIHGGHVNVTDGRYVYMRAAADPGNGPLEEFTLMPTHMRSRFGVGELRTWEPGRAVRLHQGPAHHADRRPPAS